MDRRSSLLLKYLIFHVASIVLFVLDGAFASLFETAFTTFGINTGGTPIGIVAIALMALLVLILFFGLFTLIKLRKVLTKKWGFLLAIEFAVFVIAYLNYIF